jgi:hypothetical protein
LYKIYVFRICHIIYLKYNYWWEYYKYVYSQRVCRITHFCKVIIFQQARIFLDR